MFSKEAHELWFNWGSNRQTRELLSPLGNHESSISRLMVLVPFFPPTHARIGLLDQVSHLPPQQFPQAHSQPYFYNSDLRLTLPNPLSDHTFRDLISNFTDRHNHVVMILAFLTVMVFLARGPSSADLHSLTQHSTLTPTPTSRPSVPLWWNI